MNILSQQYLQDIFQYAFTPFAMEEKIQGQKELIQYSLLPRILEKQSNTTKTIQELYREKGIVIKENYNLFLFRVILPLGWKIHPIDNPLWSLLLDQNMKVHGIILYNACAYDTRARFIPITKELIWQTK